MRQSAAWLLAAGLVCSAGCQRTVAKMGVPPEAPAAGAVAAAPSSVGADVAVRPPAGPGAPPSSPAGAPGDPAAAPPPAEPEPKPRVGKEIVIAWEASLMYLIKDGKLVGEPLILNGARRQYLRPQHLGEFKVSEKTRLKRSNLYDVNGDPLPDKKMAPQSGAVMRNWMRLGKLAVGLHYSPAFRFHRSASARHRSHGCYRMSRKDSDYVFKWAPVATPVHVLRYIGGSEWQFLVAQTPPDLLPGYRAPRTAASTTAKRTGSRSASRSAKPRTPAPQSAAAPTAAKPEPEPTPPPDTAPAAAKPDTKPAPQPDAPDKPAPTPPGALDSGSAARPAPAQPAAPSPPAAPEQPNKPAQPDP